MDRNGCDSVNASSSYSSVAKESSSRPSNNALTYALRRNNRDGNGCSSLSPQSGTPSFRSKAVASSDSLCETLCLAVATFRAASRNCRSHSSNTNSCYKTVGHPESTGGGSNKSSDHPFNSQCISKNFTCQSHRRFSSLYEVKTMKGICRSFKIIYRPLSLFVAGAASYRRADRFSECPPTSSQLGR